MIMFTNNPLITIEENTADIAAISPNEREYATFNVTAHENIQPGTSVTFGYFSGFSTRDIQSNFTIQVGLQIEDFETGDLSMFDWQHTGHAPWEITDSVVYEGQFSLVSGSIQNHQISTIELPVSLIDSGTISFWYKVSSAHNVDKLQFRLNNQVLGDWSGEVDWTYYEATIPAGNHTLRWIYSKAAGATAGQDKAWIDYITFPAVGGEETISPVFYVNREKIEFVDAFPPQTHSQEFRIINLGNSHMAGSITVPERFGLFPGSGNQNATYTVNPFSNVTYNIVFRPVSQEEVRGEIVITSNDETTPTYTIELIANRLVSEIDDLAPITKLLGNYPNPFNPQTTIHFELSRLQNVEIAIYNIKGQFVKSIMNEKLGTGKHTAIWNGTDHLNRPVSSGVYFYKFVTPETVQVNKMMLLK
jgi:hypothetical protein